MEDKSTPSAGYTHADILMPLAFTVIIDTKIRDTEMRELFIQANELFPIFGLPAREHSEIISWFNDNLPAIDKKLSGPRRNTAILIALSRFKEDLHVENIYEAMISISICDKEYKREESDLVKSAASIWGYNRPPIKIID